MVSSQPLSAPVNPRQAPVKSTCGSGWVSECSQDDGVALATAAAQSGCAGSAAAATQLVQQGEIGLVFHEMPRARVVLGIYGSTLHA